MSRCETLISIDESTNQRINESTIRTVQCLGPRQTRSQTARPPWTRRQSLSETSHPERTTGRPRLHTGEPSERVGAWVRGYVVAQGGEREREREWRSEHCRCPSENSTRTAAALDTAGDPALVVSLHIRLALAYLAIHHVSPFRFRSRNRVSSGLFLGTATPWSRQDAHLRIRTSGSRR